MVVEGVQEHRVSGEHHGPGDDHDNNHDEKSGDGREDDIEVGTAMQGQRKI